MLPLPPPATPRVPYRETATVVLGTLLLCAPWAFMFEARSTDLSALRVMHGEVPYRDFWTMYAPGCFLVLSVVFGALGEQLIWSNLLGIVTTAAAAGALHRLVSPWLPRRLGLLAALVFALAFINSGYHDGFGTYPPAILCVLIAMGLTARSTERGRRLDLVMAGAALGIGACFKHDVAGYAALACAVGALRGGRGGRIGRLALLLVPAAIPVAAMLAWLRTAGAWPDMIEDLWAFPTTHFRHVRPEGFPIKPPLPEVWPSWSDTPRLYRALRDLAYWAILHLPTIALLGGLAGAWERGDSKTPAGRTLVTIAAVAFPFYWFAAHVQINTHKVTLAALGLVVASVGLAERPRLLAILFALWSLVLLAEPFETMRLKLRDGLEPVGLPRLAGIRVTPAEAMWMRGLHRALADAGPPEAPLLFAGARNDVLIFAYGAPFWLSDRRAATRHHELHPGVTDTEPVQRRMLADAAARGDPVVVREHRFSTKTLDFWRKDFLSHGVPVGSALLDEWIAARYRPRGIHGAYEVMERVR